MSEGFPRLVGVSFILVMGCATTDPWDRHLATLEISGVSFVGDRADESHWRGVGVWVAPDAIVTSASTALRAGRIVGTTLGVATPFTRLVALDRGADLALLAAETSPGIATPFATGASGVTFVAEGIDAPESGRVSAEAGAGQDARLVLGIDVSRGALLFDEEGGGLLGVATGGPKTRAATPAVAITRLLAARRAGVPIAALFTLVNAASWLDARVARNACLAPGEAFRLPWSGSPGSDVFIDIAPVEAPSSLAAALVRGTAVSWKGIAGTRRTLGFGLSPNGGRSSDFDILVVNPARATARSCATIRVGGVAWERAL